MTTSPFHPSQVKPTKLECGSHIQASWTQKVDLGDVRVAGDGKIHLAIKLTGSAGPAYGLVTLDGEGRVVHAAGWPAGVYLPSLFPGPDHELFVLQEKESAAWKKAQRKKYPDRFDGAVVGHVPDAGAGGIHAGPGATAMALNPGVNASIGGQIGGMKPGDTYTSVTVKSTGPPYKK